MAHDRNAVGQGPDFPAQDLPLALASVWQRFEDGVATRRSAFHTPTLISNGSDGWPNPRTVVLRAVDRASASLRCHTDRRAPKTAELTADDRVALLVYAPSTKLQVRLWGTARLANQGAVADAAWAASTLWARRCYAAPHAPGAPTGGPDGNLPDELIGRQPSEAEAEAGRVNFTTVTIAVSRIDWLYLAATGHRRGLHVRAADGWTSSWIAP